MLGDPTGIFGIRSHGLQRRASVMLRDPIETITSKLKRRVTEKASTMLMLRVWIDIIDLKSKCIDPIKTTTEDNNVEVKVLLCMSLCPLFRRDNKIGGRLRPRLEAASVGPRSKLRE
jgi:hypothetical protein